MSIKLKVLGLGLLAVMATSAFSVMNAGAVVGGHFIHKGAGGKAVITGHEAKGTSHQLKFYHLKTNSHETDPEALPIECETAKYEGTVTTETVTSIQMYPTYTKCNTEGGVPGSVTVTPNGCSYTFFSQGANKHGTAQVDCAAGKAIVINHPNCEITIPAQTTMTEGLTYTATVEGQNSITADVTVNTITGQYHGGICIFLGTTQKFEMKGSVTVKGYEHLGGKASEHNIVEGAQVSISQT